MLSLLEFSFCVNLTKNTFIFWHHHTHATFVSYLSSLQLLFKDSRHPRKYFFQSPLSMKCDEKQKKQPQRECVWSTSFWILEVMTSVQKVNNRSRCSSKFKFLRNFPTLSFCLPLTGDWLIFPFAYVLSSYSFLSVKPNFTVNKRVGISGIKDAILNWCQSKTKEYEVTEFRKKWFHSSFQLPSILWNRGGEPKTHAL